MLMIADVSQAGHGVVMADVPDPEVTPRAQSSTFAPSYKARILAGFEAVPKAERAGFLRREGLYSTLIRRWQAQAARAVEGAGHEFAGRPSGLPTRSRRPKACAARRTAYPSRSPPARGPNASAETDSIRKSAQFRVFGMAIEGSEPSNQYPALGTVV